MRHTALLDLPDLLTDAGMNVLVTDDWELGQGNYRWTDPHTGTRSYNGPPSGYMVHHTAGTRATPPPHDTSKANAWIGLLRNGKLYQTGGGTPTIYLASAGPARISSGYGYHPAAWAHTFIDRRAPAKAEGPDGIRALNRYVFNVEVVHPGNGTPLDAGVRRHVVGLGIGLHQMFGWTERTLGHLSWTRRKIDPYWNGDRLCIIDIQDAIAEGTTDIGVTVEEEEEYMKLGDKGINVEKWQDYLNRWLNEYRIAGEPLKKDGDFGPITERRTTDFQRWSRIEPTGQVGYFEALTMGIAIQADTG